MADGRHLGERDKSRYLRKGLTNLDEIWHDDVYWTPGRHRHHVLQCCGKFVVSGAKTGRVHCTRGVIYLMLRTAPSIGKIQALI